MDYTMSTQQKRHTPEQIVRIVGQADRLLGEGKTAADVGCELEVVDQICYRWRNQYGGMKDEDAKRLKELEKQNATSTISRSWMSTLPRW